MLNSEEIEEDQDQRRKESKELQRLKSYNRPGTGEEGTENYRSRQRQLSIAAAKANYDIAKDNFLGKMDQMEDPERRVLSEPQLREEYKDVKYSERKLLKAAEEFKKAIERSGSTTEIGEVDDEVVTLQTRIGAFKHGCKIA